MKSSLLSAINDLAETYYSYVPDEYFASDDNLNVCDLDAINDSKDELIYCDDYEYISDNLCLLALEYYNIMCNVDGVDYYDDEDIIIDNMKKLNKDSFVKFLLKNSDYISDMFLQILEQYIGKFPLREYSYFNIEDIILNDKSFELYKKFHPSLNDELISYKEYKVESSVESDIYDKNIRSLLELLSTTIIASYLLSEDELIDLVHDKIWFIKLTNDKLYKEVILFLAKYYYICARKRIKEYGDLGIGEVTAYEFILDSDIDEIVSKAPEHVLVNNFINFDFMQYLDEENKLDNESKQFIKKFDYKKGD